MSKDVLIVDDSATMRLMVKKVMAMAGLDVGEVFEAANGIEALAQLHDHDVAARHGRIGTVPAQIVPRCDVRAIRQT